jgi:hypothetical protein
MAEGLEVIVGVGTSVPGGNDVVNFIGGNQKSGLKTLFAKRMFGYIQVTDGTPAPTVNFVMVGGTLEAVIIPFGDDFMSVAVAAVADQFRTSGI